MCTKDAAGNVTQEWKGQEQVAAHQREAWQHVLNIEGWDIEEVREDMEEELAHVSTDATCQVPEHLRANFDEGAMFHKKNIQKAINRLKRGSSPGIDKINADLVLLLADDEAFLDHLQDLFTSWHANSKMGDASRTAMMTTLFKDKPGARTGPCIDRSRSPPSYTECTEGA